MARGSREPAPASSFKTKEKKEELNIKEIEEVKKEEQSQTVEKVEEEAKAPTEKESIKEVEEANQMMIERTKANVNRLKERVTMEDTHSRATFLVDKELLKRLNAVAEQQPRGFKTAFINDAIEELLKDYE